MHKTKLVFTLTGMMAATTALALPPFIGIFKQVYKPKGGTALVKANCGVCHVGTTTKLNPYGMDLKKVLVNKTLNAAALKKVEGLDSDKDGARNGAEIKKGTLPGDAKSK